MWDLETTNSLIHWDYCLANPRGIFHRPIIWTGPRDWSSASLAAQGQVILRGRWPVQRIGEPEDSERLAGSRLAKRAMARESILHRKSGNIPPRDGALNRLGEMGP